MKQSQFNIFIDTQTGKKLAFNSLTGGLAIVDDNFFSILNNINSIQYDDLSSGEKEIYDNASIGRFIIEDDFDELLDIQTKRQFQKYNTNSLGLTIAPTLNCNFKCIYCYENEAGNHGVMSDYIQMNILGFIKRFANIKKLSINWYGGEPLLAKKEIYNLSKMFIEYCKDNNIEYDAFMITNGSLITDTDINDFIKYKIKNIQVTIDGIPEIHNKRRMGKNIQDTFSVIINNINKLLSCEEDINIILRINIDKANTIQLEQLFDVLSKKLISKKVKIDLGRVEACTETCKSIESNCYKNSEYADIYLNTYKYIQKYGFLENSPLKYPEAKYNFCCTDYANSFVLDFEGNLYKCWNSIGNKKESIGNIENMDITNHRHGQWLLWDPLKHTKCKECDILPLCMGGCPYYPILDKTEPICDAYKYNLKDFLLYHYEKTIV